MDQTTDPRAPTPPSRPPSTPSPPPVAAPPADVSADPVADLSKAPVPTASTLRRRRSLPVQAVRFAVFNTRIIRMVLKGHH